jgi:predicted DsbA family dithiol-disulfide isomerase
MEKRGEDLGIEFRRGRTWSSNSHLALEAAEYAMQTASEETAWAFHRRLLKAYFTDLADLYDVELLVGLADEVGVDGAGLREALADRRFEAEVDQGIAWSRQIGVTAIPTFIFNERAGMVGAQELPAFRELMRRMGNPPKATS